MTMMTSKMSVVSIINYVAAFLSAILAGLIGFDWLAFFTPEQALQVVAALNLIGLTVKAWMSTAEQMARTMTTTPQGDANASVID